MNPKLFQIASGVVTESDLLSDSLDDPGLAEFARTAEIGDSFNGDENSPVDYEIPVTRIA